MGFNQTSKQNHYQVSGVSFKWNGISSKRKGEKWEAENLSYPQRNSNKDVNGLQFHKSSTSKEAKLNHLIDFDKLPLLSGLPKTETREDYAANTGQDYDIDSLFQKHATEIERMIHPELKNREEPSARSRPWRGQRQSLSPLAQGSIARWGFLSHEVMPPFIVPCIDGWVDVARDGNCGYRVIALFMYGSEDWWLNIRR